MLRSVAMARRGKDREAIHNLSDLVAKVYPSREPEEVRAIRAFVWWEKAVPRRVLENARPVGVRRGVMTVHTATSVWANELEMLKPQLLDSLRRNAPKSGVRDIRVRVGKLPPLQAPPPVRPPLPATPVADLPEELARALAAMGDDGLRTAVHRAASVSLGRARTKKR